MQKLLNKVKKPVQYLGPLIIGALIGAFFGVVGTRISESSNTAANIKNTMNATVSAIEKKKQELNVGNLTPTPFFYSNEDTILQFTNEVEFEYDLYYDHLLSNPSYLSLLDDNFCNNLIDFKISHKKLKRIFMEQPNDSLRKIVTDKILSHASLELSIIKGEHLWIDGEISDDSLNYKTGRTNEVCIF